MPQNTILKDRLKKALDDLKISGMFNDIKVLETPQDAWVYIKGRKILNLCSNNFLGFANDSKVKIAAQAGIEKYGCGPGAVRSISGTSQVHIDFENALAKYKHTDSAIVVQSGFNANTALIPTIIGKNDAVISDELNHASLIDAIRLTKAHRYIYSHSNMEELESKLKIIRANPEVTGMVLIVTDGVFSMDGDIANLPDIVRLAKKYDAYTYVDDAWGEFGLGKNGRGTVEHYSLHGEIDLETGTLSKGFGLSGGFIAGKQFLIDYLRQRSRPFLFSTGLNLSTCAAGLAILEELTNDISRIHKLWANTRYFKEKLVKIGFKNTSPTQIIPIMVYEEKKAQEMSKLLMEEGVYVTPIVFPTVTKGKARCRIIISAAHTTKDLDFGLSKVEKVAKQLKLIK